MKQRLLAFSLLFAIVTTAQDINIIPKPFRTVKTEGNFSITPATQIILEETGLEKSAQFLNDYLQQFYGFRLPVIKNGGLRNKTNLIRLDIEKMDNSIPGAYTLVIDKSAVTIGGDNATGTFYGIQSLIQLLPLEKK
jgi:hexosaminidase